MRIAYVNTNYQSNHTGGGHVHMEQFINNAVALGHEIWTYPSNSHPEAQIIPTTRLDHIRTMRKMDVLYVRIEKKSLDICAWALPPRRLLYGFPIVAWEFNTIPDDVALPSKNARDLSAIKQYGRGCDLAVCVSSLLGQVVRERLGLSRILVVPNGSDPQLFCSDAHLANRMLPFQRKFNIVWIGTGKEKWHDLQMLREAAKIIYDEMDLEKNILFHLIGPDLAGIMADMPPNVYYWGGEYYDKLPNWLAAMDVGLDLMKPGSGDYGSPLKLFDYMASELSVVSTEQPQVREVLDKMDATDLLVEPGNANKLANVIGKLASNRKRVKKLGQLGRQLVINHYNWKRAVTDTMSELETLLQERKGRQGK